MIVTVSCNGILIEVGFKGFFKRVIKRLNLLYRKYVRRCGDQNNDKCDFLSIGFLILWLTFLVESTF